MRSFAIQAPAITYTAAAPAVIKKNIEIPITKTVHYADEPVVTGHTTNIIKPTINAPAISAPRTLVGKSVTNPATVSVRKYAAEVKTVNPVPAPYDVPYDVPQPYAVPTPVHTAPVEVRKRVYAPTAYAAPAVAVGAAPAYPDVAASGAVIASSAALPVGGAHAPVAAQSAVALRAAAFSPLSLGAIDLDGLDISTYALDLEDCDCDE
ncbi:hypothetical protein FJT64_016520 [Amphibalanus amphitrite]|uniref:Uncharacterized protein n=1 Tax=Amphibalanus amphitrite TaxID=1232801 RepID=A0A6A4WZ67_AMPAM|nr:hypothetical protein FJT64_016520 [Amphibalanus amphitrite]